MPVLRSARALAEAPITTVKKNPIDESVKSLQDQLAAAHAQNERDKNEIKSLRAEVAQVKEEKTPRSSRSRRRSRGSPLVLEALHDGILGILLDDRDGRLGEGPRATENRHL